MNNSKTPRRGFLAGLLSLVPLSLIPKSSVAASSDAITITIADPATIAEWTKQTLGFLSYALHQRLKFATGSKELAEASSPLSALIEAKEAIEFERDGSKHDNVHRVPFVSMPVTPVAAMMFFADHNAHIRRYFDTVWFCDVIVIAIGDYYVTYRFPDGIPSNIEVLYTSYMLPAAQSLYKGIYQ